MKSVREFLELPNPIAEPGHEFVLSIMLASRMLSALARAVFDGTDMSEAQMNLLLLLRYQYPDGAPQAELGKGMVLNRASVTGLVDRLEKDGLVKRTSGTVDRRQKIVRITEKGLKSMQQTEKSYFEAIHKVNELVPAQKQKNTIDTLSTLAWKLSDLIK